MHRYIVNILYILSLSPSQNLNPPPMLLFIQCNDEFEYGWRKNWWKIVQFHILHYLCVFISICSAFDLWVQFFLLLLLILFSFTWDPLLETVFAQYTIYMHVTMTMTTTFVDAIVGVKQMTHRIEHGNDHVMHSIWSLRTRAHTLVCAEALTRMIWMNRIREHDKQARRIQTNIAISLFKLSIFSFV